MVIAALASLTIIVLKLVIIASRADDSQQTLVTVPVINTVSKPRERSRYGRSQVPGMNALKRYLRTISSSGRTSRSGQSS